MDPPELIGSQVIKDESIIAITTPIAAKDGTISKKTPVFHLPVYKIHLDLKNQQDNETTVFHCDLADLRDLIEKLKVVENLWKKSQNK